MASPNPESRIRCPACGKEFELSEALTGHLRTHLRQELEAETAVRLKQETERIEKDVRESVKASYEVELKDRSAALEASKKALADAQQQELQLRKQHRELIQTPESMEVEIARTLDAEREKIRAYALEKFAEDHNLKDREKDKMIGDLRRSLDEAKRKAEQGSMEIQGEVLELNLEEDLQSAFPGDRIEPVPKGIRGADVLQRVIGAGGAECGTIVWETKNTKSWSEAWVQKLKDDQVAVGGRLAVLVTRSLPADVPQFGMRDGLWISDWRSALGLASALRQQLEELAFEKRASVGKNEKMESLYHYLSGPDFRHKVTAVVETFNTMHDQLHRERRAMEKNWKEREKQIQRVTLNMSGLYGDIRGIAGAAIPDLEILELETGDNQKQLPGSGDKTTD